MWKKETKMRWLSFKTFIVICFVFSNLTYGKDYSDLKNAQKLLVKRKKEILKLSKREKKTFKNLAKLEKEISRLKDKISKEETKLRRLKKEIKRIEEKILFIKEEITFKKKILKEIIKIYWNFYVRNMIQDFQGKLVSFNIYKNWILILTLQIKDNLEDLRKFSNSLRRTLKEKREIQNKIFETTKFLIKQREALLDKKLYLINQIKKIRAIKLYKEAQLKEIRDLIKRLKLTSISLFQKKINALKGYLPWPVNGKVILKFDLRSRPPIEGIRICVNRSKKVKAVLWGKVVFADKLRGFGKVVIIFHGNNFYSLYAYLKESYVFVGQRVEQSEPIGEVGFCPKCKGLGLYFEIRHGKKPLNPLKWLKDRRSG